MMWGGIVGILEMLMMVLLMVLLMVAPGLDLLLFVPQEDTSSLVTPEEERSMAQVGRLGLQ